MKNSHPRIGIRPIIDGRRGGIRESLEEMTMGMAQSVAKLYTEKLRYADGTPVECVIADRTIGGVEEAAGHREIRREQRRGSPLGDTLLVLRLRNHRHGPADAQSHLGLQQNPASGSRLSRLGAGPGTIRRDCPHSASTAPKCRSRTTTASHPTWRRNCCVSAAPPSPSCR